mmetsp:Transcript_24827/g.69192  ORF Transcript_24827/g.69192 Transcript_24827/m.69192 type:complete len:85 (-) Transcript_24827:691-945(-)
MSTYVLTQPTGEQSCLTTASASQLTLGKERQTRRGEMVQRKTCRKEAQALGWPTEQSAEVERDRQRAGIIKCPRALIGRGHRRQ